MSSNPCVAGIEITHPDRVLFPEQGVTKLALAEYYETIADWILPHVARRPLSVVRCPRGSQEECFYQKHLGEGWPEPVYGIDIEEKGGGTVPYLAVRDLEGLVSLVQFGVLEIHPWGCREDRIERPDRLIFDLDPGSQVPWKRVLEAARRLRDVLAQLELESFVRTTGGKGLHVVVPLVRRSSWDEVKDFAKAVAESVEKQEPGSYVTNVRKEKRRGKILVDYLRNSRGSTAVASYSTRARRGAPVATNLAWEELDSLASAAAYDIASLPRRLAALEDDPWAGFSEPSQSITRPAWRRLEG